VPVAGLPLALRLFSWLLPLQHYNAILRAVMLKGAGLAAIWPNLIALVAIAILMTILTLTLLKRIGDS
jgi:ABC-2 type transport system permease protein